MKVVVSFILVIVFALTISCSGDSGNNNDNDILPSSGSEGEFVSSSSLTAGAQSSSSGAEISSSSSEKNTSSSSSSITENLCDGNPYNSATHFCNAANVLKPINIPVNDFTFDDIRFWVGEGENKSVMILKWNDGKTPSALAYGYKWSGTKYGIDMIMDIVKADKKLFALVFDSGFDTGYGYAIGGVGYDVNDNGLKLRLYNNVKSPNSNNLFITNAYDFDDWTKYDTEDRWQSGWYDGYWSYWVTDSFGDNWLYSNWGASSRALTNNSVDAWWFEADMDYDTSIYFACVEPLGDDCDGRNLFGDVFPIEIP